MKKEYILFYDSGIGGLSTLQETIKIFNYNYLYYADNKHSPYGNQTKEAIFFYIAQVLTELTKKFSIKFVVIACNTATAAAISQLRNQFKDITFIGTEPAINLAKKFNFKNILSLTTPLTMTLDKYKLLLTDDNIITIGMPNLAKSIENYYLSPSFFNKTKLLKQVCYILKKSTKYDCIVLGCTHFVFLKPFIRQFSKINLVDGNTGISKNLIAKLNSLNIKQTKKSYIKILLSDKNKIAIKKYKKILCQTLAKWNELC